MEWFSAIDIAKTRKIIEKSNASAFPYQRKRQRWKKAQ
jgi:hypothetical protein